VNLICFEINYLCNPIDLKLCNEIYQHHQSWKITYNNNECINIIGPYKTKNDVNNIVLSIQIHS